jgi:hypothetical protein
MRRLAIAVIALAMVLTFDAGSSAGARTQETRPTSQAVEHTSGTLPITIDVLIRTAVFPTESCCHWVARHSHFGFRDGVVDRCATGDRLLPRRYGVVTRQFIYRSIPPDSIVLDSARSTIVKLAGKHAAEDYYRTYVHEGFDCRPRHVDGGSPGGATAVYKVVRRAAGRTVIADEITESGATTMGRYIDIRPVGRFLAIVEYVLGEDIDTRPDLRRVDAIADAQQRRLERRMS